MQIWQNLSVIMVALAMASGCGGHGDDPNAASQAITSRDGGAEGAAGFDQSVAIHGQDLNADGWEAFSLERSLQAIIDTNEGATDDTTTPAELLEGLFAGMDVSEEGTHAFVENPVSNLPMEVEDIDVASDVMQVDNYRAMALFNRLDLAPADWSTCGEFRIVYEFEGSGGAAWLIFESMLPNPLLRPDGSGHPLGCKPALDLWASLPSMRAEERAIELARFYYEGAGGVDAVVRHANYATGLGQVRTNHIGIGSASDFWQLREFRTDNDADGKSVFRVDTVKGNALTEFYGAGLPAGIEDGTGEARLFREEQLDYLRGFVTVGGESVDANDNGIPDRLEELLAPELLGESVIGGFGLGVDDRYNEWMSVSASEDNPGASGFTLHQSLLGLQTEIDNALGQDEVTDELERITAEHVMNRVDSQTCGGCHRTTSNREIAPGVRWPEDNSFVHARSNGLSDALVNRFLPARQAGFAEAVIRFADDMEHVSRFDFNADGRIDGADFGVALSNWGQSCGDESEVEGDFNGDCVVDGGDLGMMLSVWGRKYFPDAPTTLRSLAPGGETEGSPTRLEVMAARVAEARTARQRDAALNRLRNARQAEEERQRALQGAFMRVRPVH